MNLAGILNGLASGVGAAKAVHADLKEELCSIYVKIKYVANKAVFCYLHFSNPFIRKIYNGISISQKSKKINIYFKDYYLLFEFFVLEYFCMTKII